MSKRSIVNASKEAAGGRRVAACADLSPATEAAVEQEIFFMLRERFFAVELDDFTEPTKLPKGTLVYSSTSSRRSMKRSGISRGIADLLIARVGTWGWKAVEVKKRGKNGVCGGSIRTAQDTAQLSGLSTIVWCSEHVRQLVHRADQKAGRVPF